MASPNDSHDDGKLGERLRSRSSALFLTPSRQAEVREMVREAYNTRSKYVHGDVLRDLSEEARLKALSDLRLLMREIVLRWLVLTPADAEDLAPRLDAAANGTDPAAGIEATLRAFFDSTPPQDTPVM